MAKLHTPAMETKRPDPSKTHNVVVTNNNSESNSFNRHSTQSIQAFIRDLEPAAARLETDKSGGALLAIVATLRFLQTLPARPHLWAPFEEGVDLIAKTIDPKMISKKTEDRVVKSIAVSLQRENKINLRDALKNIVGRDPVASKKLEDFRNNMLEKNIPKGARDRYHEIRRSFFNDLPPKSAIALALTMCKAREGKKS